MKISRFSHFFFRFYHCQHFSCFLFRISKPNFVNTCATSTDIGPLVAPISCTFYCYNKTFLIASGNEKLIQRQFRPFLT